jgi:hypothetical protein
MVLTTLLVAGALWLPEYEPEGTVLIDENAY